MARPEYGDNIFEIMGVVSRTLRKAQWPRQKVDEIVNSIMSTQSYDEAVNICRTYITIDGCEGLATPAPQAPSGGEG